MNRLLLRAIVLAALALSLVAGPSLALCGSDLSVSCCCSKGQCPKPQRGATNAPCCSPSSAPFTPVVVTTQDTPTGVDDTLVARSVEFASTRPPIRQRARTRVAHGPSPPAVPLFTLHDALLI